MNKYKIIGMDESGAFGSPEIVFSVVEFNEEYENDLIIHNILKSGDFFLQEKIINGWDKKTKLEYAKSLISRGIIELKFYKLDMNEQNAIIKDLVQFQSTFLFNQREILIKAYNEGMTSKKNMDILSKHIENLSIYRKSYFLPEFCLKSYSYLYIMNRCCTNKKYLNFLDDPSNNNRIKFQIDGGGVMSFWWYDLIESHPNKENIKNKLFINGITHGDNYYVSMNVADMLARSFIDDSQHFQHFPMESILYDFSNKHYPADKFFERIFFYSKWPKFKDRLLFIGNTDLFNILPHSMLVKDRNVVREPYKISESVTDFLHKFKIGKVDQTTVVHSEKLTTQNKEDIKECKKIGFNVHSIKEFSEDITSFLDAIEQASDYYSPDDQGKVKKAIGTYKKLIR